MTDYYFNGKAAWGFPVSFLKELLNIKFGMPQATACGIVKKANNMIKNPAQGNPAPNSADSRQIKIADNIPGAEYANAMQVNHNKDEFQLMFLNLMGMSGRVTGKIIVSPGHCKRMIAALQDNLKKYEERFGDIKEAAAPEGKEIGFRA